MSEYVYAGLTDQTIDIFIQDSSSTSGAGLSGLAYNTSGLIASYRKGATGSRAPLSLATQTVGGAHSDGGFVEIDATHMKGTYRLDLSDAMVDTEGFVTIYLYGAANMVPVVQRVDCRPLPADVKKVDSSATAASNLKKSAEAIVTGTVTTGATTTSVPTSALSPAGGQSNQFKNRLMFFLRDTTTADLRGQVTEITAVSASATPTFTVSPALTDAPASGDTFVIL